MVQKSRRCDILIVGSYEVITLPSAVRPVGAGRAFFVDESMFMLSVK